MFHNCANFFSWYQFSVSSVSLNYGSYGSFCWRLTINYFFFGWSSSAWISFLCCFFKTVPVHHWEIKGRYALTTTDYSSEYCFGKVLNLMALSISDPLYNGMIPEMINGTLKKKIVEQSTFIQWKVFPIIFIKNFH